MRLRSFLRSAKLSHRQPKICAESAFAFDRSLVGRHKLDRFFALLTSASKPGSPSKIRVCHTTTLLLKWQRIHFHYFSTTLSGHMAPFPGRRGNVAGEAVRRLIHSNALHRLVVALAKILLPLTTFTRRSPIHLLFTKAICRDGTIITSQHNVLCAALYTFEPLCRWHDSC